MRNYTKTISTIVIILVGVFFYQNSFAAGTCGTVGGKTGTSPYTAESAKLVDVADCVADVEAGATIYVPAGSVTWTDNLHITKAITIIGAGIGKTNITGSFTATSTWAMSPDYWHIAIVPATPADNPIIRISGFTFTFGPSAGGIFYYNTSTTSDLTNVRLDHLSIYSPPGKFVFYRYGLAHGVMDNCKINGLMDMGGAATLWTANSFEFGTKSNFYFEDNVFTAETTTAVSMYSGNGAGRYAFRYNTIKIPTNKQVFPIFDVHGNQYNVRPSGFGAEIYGNAISTDGNAWTTVLYNQRGGKSLVFNNPVTWTTGGGIQTLIKEEHLDSDGSGVAINAINGQPQHVSNSYYWNNTGNGIEIVPILVDELGIGMPTENTHVWFKKAPFDGSVGMGCGTLANRPKTCKTGVGYWATEQSCTNMTGMAGANPSTPIKGTLYRCNASGAWETYYTPYQYPHPLRISASDGTLPIVQSTLYMTSVNGTVTSSPTGINCGLTCYANFDSGAAVALTASPNSGYTFTGWSGGGCTGTGTCTVSMTSAQVVTANYAKTTYYKLSARKNFTSGGTVTSSDSRINCGKTCEVNYEYGKTVTLIATPSSNYKFSRWTGACSGTGSCTVSMTAAKYAQANFYK